MLEMISDISELLLTSKSVEGRLSIELSPIYVRPLKSHTLGKAEAQETASQRVMYGSSSHPLKARRGVRAQSTLGYEVSVR